MRAQMVNELVDDGRLPSTLVGATMVSGRRRMAGVWEGCEEPLAALPGPLPAADRFLGASHGPRPPHHRPSVTHQVWAFQRMLIAFGWRFWTRLLTATVDWGKPRITLGTSSMMMFCISM